MRSSRRLLRVLPALAAFVLAGCGSVLKPKPDPTRFFVLEPSQAVPGNVAPSWSGAVGFLPVRLPAYLADHREFVVRNGAELDYQSSWRWAEPRARSVGDRLRRSLADRLPAARVEGAPWSDRFRPTVLVDVEFESLEPRTDGAVALVARWEILDAATRAVVGSGSASLLERADVSGPEGAVRATGLVLDQLADRLAAAIVGNP